MERVTLRQWTDADLAPLTTMNSDPAVMRFFPKRATHEESRAMLERLRGGIAERGWGLWAVDVDGEFAGFAGLAVPRFTAAFTPCIEAGWRFRPEFWGRGIAFRAASEAVLVGFSRLRLEEIVSFTAVANAPSRRLMERLGFVHHADEDFDHPLIDAGHPLRRHVLYRLSRPAWERRHARA